MFTINARFTAQTYQKYSEYCQRAIEMNVAIMQPYLFPYIGYFQLLNAVDTFVILDNVNFIKKGWINRNQILSNNGIVKINLPVAKMSQNRWISQHAFFDLSTHLTKLIDSCAQSYSRSDNVESITQLLHEHLEISTDNVSEFLTESLLKISKLLGLHTNIIKASDIDIDHSLTGQDRIIELASAANANTYVNLIGGTELYQESEFARRHMKLKFIEPNLSNYPQMHADVFIPYLSILDVIANCDGGQLQQQLSDYKLR